MFGIIFSALFKLVGGVFYSVVSTIWNNPILRYTVMIVIGLCIALFYGQHLTKERDAQAAKDAAYESTIQTLQKSLALQQRIVAQNDADKQVNDAMLAQQAASLKSYEDYIATSKINATVQEGKKYVPTNSRSSCVVDSRLLNALGLRAKH